MQAADAEKSPGQRLRELRVTQGRKGWSQEKLAAKAGVSVGTIAWAERDRIPTLMIQVRIARALEVDRLLIWPDGPGPAPRNQEKKWNLDPAEKEATR